MERFSLRRTWTGFGEGWLYMIQPFLCTVVSISMAHLDYWLMIAFQNKCIDTFVIWRILFFLRCCYISDYIHWLPSVARNQTISIAYPKIAETPLLMHWSYCSFAVSHHYVASLEVMRSSLLRLSRWLIWYFYIVIDVLHMTNTYHIIYMDNNVCSTFFYLQISII